MATPTGLRLPTTATGTEMLSEVAETPKTDPRPAFVAAKEPAPRVPSKVELKK